MIDEAKEMSQTFVHSFIKIFNEDDSVGITMLISSFISCYGMMDKQSRALTLIPLLELLNEISGETFEDGGDFVSFLRDKLKEKQGEVE